MKRPHADDLALLEGGLEAARAEGPSAEGRQWTGIALCKLAAGDVPGGRKALAEAEARVHAAGQATDEKGKRAWITLRGAIAFANARFDSEAGSIGAAADGFELAAGLAAEAGDASGRADALLSLAAINARLGKILDAAVQAEEAEDLYIESGSRSGDVAARAVADRMAAQIEDSEELGAVAEEDLEAAREPGGDPRRLGWLLRNSGTGCLMQEEAAMVEEAQALFEEASRAFRAADSRPGEARAIRSEAVCLLTLGHAVDAADAFLEAAAIYAEAGAPLAQGRSMLEAADASRLAGDAKRAGECYEGSAALFRKEEAPFEEGFALEALGDMRLDEGKSAVARGHYETALKLYESLEHDDLRDQRAACLYSFGLASSDLGMDEEAQEKFEKARALYEELEQDEMVEKCDEVLKKLGARRR